MHYRVFKCRDWWYLDIRTPGYRKRISLKTKNEKEAIRKARELSFNPASPLNSDTSTVTWSKFLPRYKTFLDTQHQDRPATLKRYLYCVEEIEKFLAKNPSIVYLHQTDSKIIEDYKSERRKTLKPESVNYELKRWRSLFRQAVRWKDLSPNQVPEILSFRTVKQQKLPNYLTEKEWLQFITTAKCEPTWYRFFMTSYYTGLRRNAVRTLKWENIDFKNNKIKTVASGGFMPKSREQIIPLHPSLKKLFLTFKRPSGFIFTGCTQRKTEINTKDHPLHENAPTRAFERIQKKAKIKGHSLHDLRHTLASHLRQKGVDLQVIAQILGHSSVSMTEIYAQIGPSKATEALNLLPDWTAKGQHH